MDPEKLQDSGSQTYYWMIRTSTKMREHKGSIVVAFYPSLAENEVGTHVAHLPGLDDATTASINTANSNDSSSGSSDQTSNFESGCSGLESLHPPCTFHFFAEDELGKVPTSADLGMTTNLASEEVGLQIKKWFHECNERHTKCIKTSKATWVATRLLDLQFGDGSSIRLASSKDEDVKGPYVTLSHCWGPPNFVKATPETENKHMTEGIRISELKSRKLEQAIIVARYLAIRYIWIGESMDTQNIQDFL